MSLLTQTARKCTPTLCSASTIIVDPAAFQRLTRRRPSFRFVEVFGGGVCVRLIIKFRTLMMMKWIERSHGADRGASFKLRSYEEEEFGPEKGGHEDGESQTGIQSVALAKN